MAETPIVPTGKLVPPASAGNIAPTGELKPPSWTDTAIDSAKALGAGVARGASQLVGLPGTVGNLMDAGAAKIGFLSPEGKAFQDKYGLDLSGEVIQSKLSDLTGGATEYRGTTTPGKYAGTIGEFSTGALGGPGSLATRMFTGAIAPAIGSEYAGSLAEGSDNPWAKPAAQLAGAILGGIGGNIIESGVRGAISPGGGAKAADLANADYLIGEGIPVTAGQATKSGSIRGIEGNNAVAQSIANATPDSPQLQAFTTAALRKAGLDENVISRARANPNLVGSPELASPAVMHEVNKAIGERFDDALRGVKVDPDVKLQDAVIQALDEMNPPGMPAGSQSRAVPTPIYRLMAEWDNAVTSGGVMDASKLQGLRSHLGEYLASPDPAVSKAARMVRDALDDAIDTGVSAMGQPERMDLLLKAREQYRNYLAIEKAIRVNSDFGVRGVIRPQELASAAAVTQGKRAATTGRGTDINRLAQTGVDVLKPLSGPTRSVGSSILPVGELAGAAGALYGIPQMANMINMPPSVGIGAAALTAGLGGVDAARRVAQRMIENRAMSPVMQKYLRNQAVNPSTGMSSSGAAMRGATSSVPSILSEPRSERKSGGRVSAHDTAADQLVRAAERAKKGWSAETAPLLNQSDDAVAHALEVANRSI